MALPEPGRAGARELGGAPRDGDFARLLEAASAPSAHRMRVDETLGLEDADSRAARAGRFTGSPPAATAMGARPRDPRFGGGPPATDEGHATVGAGPSGHADTTGFGHGSAPAHHEAEPAVARTAAPYGPPGMAEGRTRGVPSRAAPPARTPDPSAAVAGAVAAWSRRPLKDRIVVVLFGVAALWILLSIVSTAAHDFGDATGLLVVGAVVAFLVLRNRSRRQRPPDAP
jgi:hypothetical protein